MMKRWIYLYALVLVLLAGCQSMTQPGLQPHISGGPKVSMITTPYVEFMGDEQIMEVVAYAGNPRWLCSTCAKGETSTDALTKVQSVIDRHPDLVVIQVGAYDLIAETNTHDVSTLYGNVQQMVDDFVAAKIPVVVSMLPGSDLYDDYYFNEGVDLENQAGLIPYVFTFNFTNSDITNGIDYTQAGLEALYPAFYQELETFQVGGNK